MLSSLFQFAVTVANSTSTTAIVDVDLAGKSIAHITVAPGQLGVVKLPWVNALKQQFGARGATIHSALVKGGAFHLTSSVPVTVAQWNPIEFELPKGAACVPPFCNSYANDASILLPTHVLGSDYYGLAWPTIHVVPMDGSGGEDEWKNFSGFLVITATEDGTKVRLASTAHVPAGAGVSATAPGESPTFDLDRGDVLELITDAPPPGPTSVLGQPCLTTSSGLACTGGPEYDLTGSHVTSNKPIAVLGGHDCAFVPYNKGTCDHMEETLLPTETLGKGVVLTAPRDPLGVALPTFVRILSASDGNAITLDPPLVPGFTLGAGQSKALGPFTAPFSVTGTKRLAIAQYMPGSEMIKNLDEHRSGDPSQSTAVPTEQYRTDYTFLASPTFTTSYVDVIALRGTTVTLDGVKLPASAFHPVGATPFDVAFHALEGGSHKMSGSQKFGIVTYGYAAFTSYMMPGGMDLAKLDIPK